MRRKDVGSEVPHGRLSSVLRANGSQFLGACAPHGPAIRLQHLHAVAENPQISFASDHASLHAAILLWAALVWPGLFGLYVPALMAHAKISTFFVLSSFGGVGRAPPTQAHRVD